MGIGQEGDDGGKSVDQSVGRASMSGTLPAHAPTGTSEVANSCFFEHSNTSGSHNPAERLSLSSQLHITPGMTTSRKRPSRSDDQSTDESAPIIRHAQGTAKDYNSISPSISARTNGAENPPAGLVGSPREQQRIQREGAEREAAQHERREGGRWRKWLEKYGSVELENKGSVARDHLALERTFLAWLRTSLSFASIGIAVTQLFRLNTTISKSSSTVEFPQARLRHVGKPLGATFIAISILILIIGFHRYFEAQHYIIRGKFPASRGSIVLVSVVAGALIISSLVVILAVAPGAFER